MNREVVNNRFKLAYHRIVAETLVDRPELVERARAVVAAWKADPPTPRFVLEWEKLLALPLDRIRTAIAQADSHHDWLRASSPFAEIRPALLSPDARTTLWQAVRDGQ